MKPETAVQCKCVLGEGPLWHPTENLLYWTDISTGRMFRYDPREEAYEKFYEGETVGGFTIQEDGSLLLFMEEGAVKKYQDGKLEPVIQEIPGDEDSRFNDVIADPEGRVFCGTLSSGDHIGSLYRLDKDGSITKLMEDIATPNGFGFTLDEKRMYFTESRKHVIHVFDYDKKSGEISNRRDFVKSPEVEGIPDGMTVDKDGYIWSARYNGGCLMRYNPQGEEERRIEFPVKKVTSVTFGGKDLENIYVTTASKNEENPEISDAGELFRLNFKGIKGLEEFKSKIMI